MRADILERELRGSHVRLVDIAPVALVRDVASRVRELFQERLFEVEVEGLLGELENTRGVLQDLGRLDARDIVEEPPAARVHEHRVALQLEQFEHANLLILAQRAGAVLEQEGVDAAFRAVEHDLDKVIPGAPGVMQELGGGVFVRLGGGIAQKVERVAKRRAPLLIPTGAASGVATAIRAPALDPVYAAPRGVLAQFDLPARRIEVEELSINGELREILSFDVFQRVR